MDESFMKKRAVFPLILSMSLPMVLSMLVSSLYNIVDSFFVAQISDDAMTALSLIYPVQNLINAVAIGFGVGINAVIALHLGAEEKESADMAATQGFVLSAIHGVVLGAGSIGIMPAFLRMFTSDEQVLTFGVQYSNIAFSFSLIIMVALAFEKLFQSVGRMKITMVSVLCGCVANIVLDPILIFGIGVFPALGIRGAALATGIGQVLTLVIYVVVYFARPLPVHVSRRYLALNKNICARLYLIGIPATLNQALPSLLISCLNALLAVYEQSYVVILGIYYKLQTFLYLPTNGIIQGIRPIIGYNFGAGEYQRVKKIYAVTLAMSGVIMALGTVICLVGAKGLMGLFIDHPATVQAGQAALRIICAGFVVSAISVTSSGALEGLGKGTQSLIICLCRYVIVIIPVAFLLCRLVGPTGVWHAFWITEVITAVIARFVYRRSVKIQ